MKKTASQLVENDVLVINKSLYTVRQVVVSPAGVHISVSNNRNNTKGVILIKAETYYLVKA